MNHFGMIICSVDIITILPTLMTFVVTMIGDKYPAPLLPDNQTQFLGALQFFSKLLSAPG
jgi:hypothetical protein